MSLIDESALNNCSVFMNFLLQDIDPVEQMFELKDELYSDNVDMGHFEEYEEFTVRYVDPIFTKKRFVQLNQPKQRKKTRRKKRPATKKIEWKKEPSPLIITQAERLKIFDSKKNQFRTLSLHILLAQLTAQFKNIACSPRQAGRYSTAIGHVLRFKCSQKNCKKMFSLSINRNDLHKETENYQFEVSIAGMNGKFKKI